MKPILYSILLCFLLQTLHAQTPDFPNAISAKLLFLDYKLLNAKELTNKEDITNGFELDYIRSLNNTFDIAIPFKAGIIKLLDDPDNTTMLGLDATVHLNILSNKNTIRPYLLAGIGAVSFDGNDIDFQAPVGLGFNFRFFEGFYLNLQAESRFSFTADRNNLHYGIGFLYQIGTKQEQKPDVQPPLQKGSLDSDGDGVTNDKDACPNTPGSIAALGCPDADNDGVADKDDQCPDLAGTAANGGCPDTDGDGVIDKDDKCPNEFGPASNNGCPNMDADKDGVPDKEDECPYKAGPASTKGCPDGDGDGVADRDDDCPTVAGLAKFRGCPDTDNDGVKDSEDKCPTSAGPATNNGCPVVEKEDKEVLDLAKKAVQFETGKPILKKESYPVLEQLAKILMKYPDYRLNIEGHTDDVGSEAANQKLSEDRARACYDFFMYKGINPDRVRYQGFGETKPVADNKTEAGRSLNRRVEFSLILK